MNPSSIRIRPLAEADIPLGMRLKQQSGWNQTADDWRRMLALQPDGGWVAEWNGTPVATVMTCLFDSVGWVAMMLVDQSLRRRGIGNALMQQAIASLEGRGVTSIRLDATPLGQPLYERLGFAAQFEILRHVGAPQVSSPNENCDRGDLTLRPFDTADFEQVCSLDRATTQTDRRRWIELLVTTASLRVAERAGEIAGFAGTRRGAIGTHIGPVISSDGSAAEALLQRELDAAVSNAIIDIPADHASSREVAAAYGLQPVRKLLRMTRGRPVIEERVHLWASSGPELG